MKHFVTIGLEMHCEGSETKSKVFSPARNQYSNIPNENVVAIDMGFPGILPVVNKEAVRMAIMMASVLNARIPEYMYFERKNYYYPDLPKGYQITQNPPEECVGNGGYIDIEREDGTKFRVEIDNFHLEEDTASLDHFYDTSNLDYNRAGAPLFELVTKPCIHSADDAVAFLEYMRQIYQYTGISEADSKKGQIRCDVNIDISEDENKKGTKVEIKNINSFSSVRDAIIYEAERQIALKEEGRYDEVVQETRRWDDESGTTIAMRSKEDAIDYKYFIEPNIPKYKLDPAWVKEIQDSIPMLPYERKKKYIEELGLSEFDSKILVKDRNVSDYFEEVLKQGIEPKVAANWISSILLGNLNKLEKEITDISLTSKMLSTLINKVQKGEISIKQGKEVLLKCLEENLDPEKVIEELGIKQIGSADEIKQIVLEVLEENPGAKEKYNSGRTNVIDFLVGQVMKKTRGKANPSMTYDMLKKELEG